MGIQIVRVGPEPGQARTCSSLIAWSSEVGSSLIRNCARGFEYVHVRLEPGASFDPNHSPGSSPASIRSAAWSLESGEDGGLQPRRSEGCHKQSLGLGR
jgi:hypothetical protein